jgi:hypothetical protein
MLQDRPAILRQIKDDADQGNGKGRCPTPFPNGPDQMKEPVKQWNSLLPAGEKELA